MCITENYYSHFSTKTYVVSTQKNKTYVVSTQKNHLNEMVQLSTQNLCLDCWVRKKLFEPNIVNIFLSISFSRSFGCSKNHLTETVLLSTHFIRFG